MKQSTHKSPMQVDQFKSHKDTGLQR